MAVDIKQYTEELFKAAGVSDDATKQAVSSFFSNETVAKQLGNDILRQQDYSRQSDETRATRVKAEQEYAALLSWKASEQKKIDDFWATYNDAGNGNDRQQVVHQVQSDVMTKTEYAAEQAKRDQQFVSLLKDGMNLASRHTVEFKEALDTEALAKIAAEQNLTLRQAYDAMVAPRRAEQSAEQRKIELANAREEGARDFATTHKIPIDTRTRETSMIFNQPAADSIPAAGPARDAMLRTSFADDWNNAIDAGTSTQ